MLCSQIVLKTSPKASNNSYATTIKLNHTLSAKTKSFSLIKIVKKIFKYLHFSKINIQLTYKMTIFFFNCYTVESCNLKHGQVVPFNNS